MTPSHTWALHTDLDLEQANAQLATVEVLGMAESHGKTTVYLAQRRDDLDALGQWEQVPDRDWNEEWKRGIAPVTVGVFTIVPPWLNAPAQAEIVLEIEPAQAFGTGHHETTTGCLGALQEADLRGRSVLDVGTGTGVLAIAAARLGASPVVASDIDPLALEAAAVNAARNGASVTVIHGSAGPDVTGGRCFDVVVANLDTTTLGVVADELVAALAPAGTFIGSGVSLERQEQAVASLEAAGLAMIARPGAEWVVLIGRRSQGP